MSRKLPPHPNLEHLKNQAKDLLRELKQRDPALKLSDAQHEIAKEYGFASWPKLKVHVESLSVESAPIPEQANPFVGIWKADISKSRRHPANQFQSATLQFEVVGDTVTIADIVVDDSGHVVQGRHTVRADGVERPSEYQNGYVMMARWSGSHVLETAAWKDGQVAGRGSYEVSADGKMLTVSTESQLIVLDRQ